MTQEESNRQFENETRAMVIELTREKAQMKDRISMVECHIELIWKELKLKIEEGWCVHKLVPVCKECGK